MGPPMTSSVTPKHCFHSFLMSLVESTNKNDRYYVSSEKRRKNHSKSNFSISGGILGVMTSSDDPQNFQKLYLSSQHTKAIKKTE